MLALYRLMLVSAVGSGRSTGAMLYASASSNQGVILLRSRSLGPRSEIRSTYNIR